MPRIDIRGKGQGGDAQSPGIVLKGADQTQGPPTALDAARIGVTRQEGAQVELRLRKMVRDYDSYLVSEAQKAESALMAVAERGAAMKLALDKREGQQERRNKSQQNRDYIGDYKRLLNDREREDRRAAADKARTEKTAQREKDREVRDAARLQIRQRRDEERKAAGEERHRVHVQKEQVKAFGFGAVAGGVIGGAAAGDLGGVIGAIGGGLGGGAGFAIGNMIAPGVGGIVGKAIGSAIGSLAGVAVNPYHQVYQATKPYLNYQESAYSLGRLRGESGLGIDRTLMSRSPRPFKYLEDVGMGPQDAAKALLSLGYAPQGNIPKTVTTIGTLANKTSAFAGLGEDAVTGLLGRAGAYGINAASETGTGKTQTTIDMLSSAVAQGLDHSRLLDAVEGSLDSLVQQSGRADLEGITKLTTQLAATGLPGGMTGATAKDVVSASAAMGENILQNPMTSAGLTLLATKSYGGLKTAADVARFAGVKSPDQIDPSMMQDILSAANSGRLNTALRLASSPAVQSAGHLQALGDEAFPLTGLPRDTKSIFAGNFTGLSLSASQAYNSSLQFKDMNATDMGIMHYNGKNPGYAAAVEGIYSKMFGGQATPGFDSKIGKAGYLKQLLDRGVDPEVAKDIVESAAKRGLNPLLLAAVGMQESHLNKNQGRSAMNKNGTYDSGIMQINSSWMKSNPQAFKSLAGNIDMGASWLSTTLSKSSARGDMGGSAIPSEALRGKAYAQQGDLNEAFLSLKTLEPAARTFADAVGHFEKIIDKFANIHPDAAKAGHVVHAPGKTFWDRVLNGGMPQPGQIAP